MTADPMMDRIMSAIALHQQGENAGARTALDELWREIGGEDGDPLHRCAIAHYAADLNPDPTAALTWNIRALDAARHLTDARLSSSFPGLSLATFFPSLHLNLAEDYRLIGDLAAARQHLALARSTLDPLPREGFGAMIRGGLDRLEQRIEAVNQEPYAGPSSSSSSTTGIA